MTDVLHHECGLAVIRLLHPLSYYLDKYGSALWGLEKMYLLMGKQHNRGQDGAGIACVKLQVAPGHPYLHRDRVLEPAPPWQALFKKLDGRLHKLTLHHPDSWQTPAVLQAHYPYAGEVLLGHLRYATHGHFHSVENCHPVLRSNNWRTRSLAIAGNFNLTNNRQMLQKLLELGQHPRYTTDTVTILERIGHFLDKENQALFDKYKKKGHTNTQISELISRELDMQEVLRKASKHWDGGYTMAGMVGNGDLFVARDPHGIRPAFFYQDEEVIAMASERPALATAFNAPSEAVQELPPAHVLLVKRDGKLRVKPFTAPLEKTACSFERIYFSRGSDADIYTERKALGRLITPQVLQAVDHDFDHTVFSYIPNTAQAAFYGMTKELENLLGQRKARQLTELAQPYNEAQLMGILSQRVRAEVVVHKDTTLRTFITNDLARDTMTGHVYDVTYGAVRKGVDKLVCLDDSIVRGTTLRKSILRILARLQPKCIVIASSAPQIRYPDCYGIDMSQLDHFIAFQATVALLRERGNAALLEEVYHECKARAKAENLEAENCVKAIYAPFTEEEISHHIAAMLTSPDLDCEVKVVYQPLANLRQAIPHHTGDWYFSGNYPTPGGNRVVNQAYINYFEGKHQRAY